MNSNQEINPNSSLIEQRLLSEEALFSPCVILSLVVAGVAAAAFAVLAYLHTLYPLSAYLAAGIAGSAILSIAIRYCIREGAGLRATVIDDLPPVEVAPIDREQWERHLNLPPHCANLINGTEEAAEATLSGLMRRPYIGNYETQYENISLNTKALWRLPPSQLAAFPQEMQQNFAQEAGNGRLDLFFISIKDTDAAGARNIIMHPLAMPEYVNQQQSNGLACNIKMRIYEPQGIVEYRSRYHAIPFGDAGDIQQAHFHQDPSGRDILAISPNNARFVIQPEAAYSSFYVGTRFRGRASVFYVIIDRNDDSEWQDLLAGSATIAELRNNLPSNLPFKENVFSLLNNY